MARRLVCVSVAGIVGLLVLGLPCWRSWRHWIAATAVEEAALDFFRNRNDGPAMMRRGWNMPIDDLKLLPCPFCGESLVIKDDHHGEWWAHKNLSGCFLSLIQVSDEKGAIAWNKRAPIPVREFTREPITIEDE